MTYEEKQKEYNYYIRAAKKAAEREDWFEERIYLKAADDTFNQRVSSWDYPKRTFDE